MIRNATRWLIALTIIQLLATPVVGQDGNYFRDDFEDGRIDDGDPADWREGTWNGGVLEVNDGSIEITNCAGECSIGHWSGDWSQYTDVSFRAQGRITDGEGNFALWGRSLGRQGYYAFVNTQGELGIGDVLDGINTRHRIPLGIDMSENQVVIKLDLIGDEISVSAWRAGDESIDLPLASFRDSQLTVGTVGAAVYEASGIEYEWMEVAEIVPGDVDTNDVIDVRDIDHLSAAIRGGSDSNRYDVNRDNNVDATDRTLLLDGVLKLWYGDANLDGEFNSSDFVTVFQAGEFEDNVVGNSNWATGDWNGDGDFESGDFVVAFQQGGYEIGPRAATKAVPEPHSLPMMIAGFLVVIIRCLGAVRNPVP